MWERHQEKKIVSYTDDGVSRKAKLILIFNKLILWRTDFPYITCISYLRMFLFFGHI